MATRFPQVNVDQINANLILFQQKVVNYSGNRNDGQVERHIECVRGWVREQSMSSKKHAKTDLVKGVGDVVQASITSLENISSGNTPEMIKGALSIAASVAGVVGGPYGAAAAAICSIFGSIFSAATPAGLDLATLFTEKVHEELNKFHKKLQLEKLSGMERRVSIMNKNLEDLRHGKITSIPDSSLYERDFPQLIGEIARNVAQSIFQDSKPEDLKDCVTSIALYCKAETSLLLLLSNVLASLEVAGESTVTIRSLYDHEISTSQEILDFLSNERTLGASSYLPTEGGNAFKVMALRGNIPLFAEVDEFLVGIGLKRMPSVEAVREKAFSAGLQRTKNITGSYPRPQRKGDNHYFQLINHTEFPVKVECGTAGGNPNGLRFLQDIQPYSSYERIATRSTWNFSTAGYFIIYFDGKMKSYEQRFEGNVKVFEIALSNPFIGDRKANVLDKSENVYNVSGADCWNAMTYNFHKGTHTFKRGNKYFQVFVTLGGVRDIFKYGKNETDPAEGRNGCRTWQFVLQQFDPLEDMEAGCNIL